MKSSQHKVSHSVLLALLLASVGSPAVSATAVTWAAPTASASSSLSKTKLKQVLDEKSEIVKQQRDTAFEKAVKAQLEAKGVNADKLSSSQLNDKKIRVIVELDKSAAHSKTAKPTGTANSVATIQKATDQVIAGQSSVKAQVEAVTGTTAKRSFGYLLNGFSISAKVSQVAAIKKIKGVKSVTAERVFYTQDASADEIANVQKVWQEHNLKGQGTVIAIIDSGIDPTHKDLTLDNNALEKITQQKATQDIAKLNYGKWYSDKVPFAYNYADGTSDTVYDTGASKMHGMHVAGIAAANGKGTDSTTSVVGVAPDAQLLDMKVFSNNGGGAYSDDIIAAIEDSVTLGADVLNMSLGSVSGDQSADDPEQKAVNIAAAQGVIPVISAGNNGLSDSTDATNTNSRQATSDEGTIGNPGTSADAITVASSENTSMVAPLLSVVDQNSKNVFSVLPLTQVSPNADLDTLKNKSFYVAKNGKNGIPGIGNAGDFSSDAKGKIAIVSRGSLAFTEKQANAKAAGAVGLIIIDNNTSDTALSFSFNSTLPTLGLLTADGKSLLSYLEKNPDLTYSLSVKNGQITNPASGKVSTFSSYGPTPDLSFKPDVTAPGGEIWSTANDNSYQNMSGTSMASPFVAGSSALVSQSLEKKVSADSISQYVKTDIMNTAVPLNDKDQPDAIVSPRRQGSGEIQVDKAVANKVFATTTMGQAAIALKEIKQAQNTMTVTLSNTSSEAASYSFNNYGGVWTNNTNTATAYDQKLLGAGITLTSAQTANGQNALTSEQQIQVPAGQSVTVTFQLSLPSLPTQSFVEGYLGFKTSGSNTQATDLVVPYMGFYGNWDSEKVFDDPMWDADSVYRTSFFKDENGNYLGLNAAGTSINPDDIAISPNSDKVQDTATPAFSLWRNARDVSINIYAKNPDTVTTDNQPIRTLYLDPSVTKTYYNTSSGAFTSYSNSALTWDGTAWNAKSGEDNAVADGQYYYQISAVPSGSASSVAQTQTLPIKVDTTAPTVTLDQSSLKQAEDGSYTVTAKLSDTLSGLATTGQVVVAVNGVTKTASYNLASDTTHEQTVSITLSAEQVKALQSGKNKLQVGVEDNAGNFGESSTLVQAPGQSEDGLVLYNLQDGQTITTNSALYHARYKTVTLIGAYPVDFYVNGQLVKVDPTTQTFDMEDGKTGIPLPADGKFVFSTDAAGKNIIKVIQTKLSVVEPTVTLTHKASEALTTDATTYPVTGTFSPYDNLDALVVGNLTTGKIIKITDQVKEAANNTGTFSYNVPLQYGKNVLVAQMADKDGNVNNIQKFTVVSTGDAQFEADPSTVVVFDDDFSYGLNTVSAESTFYDAKTQLLTIKGHLRHSVDPDGLKIGETDGHRNIVQVNNKTLEFSTQIKVAPNTKVSIPVQVKYQGKTIVDKGLQFYLDTTMPELSLFNEENFTVDQQGKYHIYTNENPYTLSGTASDNFDGYNVTVNGNMITNQTFSFVFGQGNNGTPYTFNVPFSLTTGDNNAEIVVSDASGNETKKDLDVHYFKSTLAQPKVTASTQALTNKAVTLTAEAVAPKDAPSDEKLTLHYSLDNGKTWVDYTEPVKVTANQTLLFKTTDQYGNESATTPYNVTNIQSEISADVVVKLSLTAAKTVKVSANFDRTLTAAQAKFTSIQYSDDNGKTWTTYTQALTVSTNKTLLFRTFDQAGNVGKTVTATVTVPTAASASVIYALLPATPLYSLTDKGFVKTKQTVAFGSAWKAGQQLVRDGKTYVEIGKNLWITNYTTQLKDSKLNGLKVIYAPNKTTALYELKTNGFVKTKQTVSANSAWKINRQVVIGNTTYIEIGKNLWLAQFQTKVTTKLKNKVVVTKKATRLYDKTFTATKRTLKKNTSWKAITKVSYNGQTYYQIGGYVKASDVTLK